MMGHAMVRGLEGDRVEEGDFYQVSARVTQIVLIKKESVILSKGP